MMRVQESGKVRLVIRCYTGRSLLFADRLEVDPNELENIMPGVVAEHEKLIGLHQNITIEIEFLDETDINQRFFRMGSTPMLMREPVEVDLTGSRPAKKFYRDRKGRGR